MILPFSSNRSSTSFSSNCLYCASLTPRAMFSKSMNMASLRSPFTPSPLGRAPSRARRASIICPCLALPGQVYSGRDGEDSLGAVEATTDEEPRRVRGRARAARPDAHDQVAGAHLRAHAALRPEEMDLPLLRARGAGGVVDLGGVPAAAARDGHLRHPLRHPLVEARQRVGGRVGALRPGAGAAAAGGHVGHAARGPRLHDQHRPRGLARRGRAARPEAQRARHRARARRPHAPGAAEALLLEVEQVAARLRAPRRQPARLLGAERIPHARRPVDRGALFRPGDAGDAADARGGFAPAARALASYLRRLHPRAATWARRAWGGVPDTTRRESDSDPPWLGSIRLGGVRLYVTGTGSGTPP